jgi:hypothetical protein
MRALRVVQTAVGWANSARNFLLEIELWGRFVSFSFHKSRATTLRYIDNSTLLLTTSTHMEDAHSASRETFASNAYLSPDFIC